MRATHPKNIYKLKHWFNLCLNHAWYYRPLCSMRLRVNFWFLFHILNINCVASLSTLGWIRHAFYKHFSTFQNYIRCKTCQLIAVFMCTLITNMQKLDNSTIGWIGSWFYGIHHFVLSTCDYKRYKLIVYGTIFNLWLNSVFVLYA